MRDWQELGKRFDPYSNPMCDTGTPIKPGDMLGHARIAVMAIEPANRDVQPDAPVQAIAVPDSTPPALVNQRAGPATGTAKRFAFRAFSKYHEQGAIRLLAEGIDNMAFPKRDRRHSIEHGGGLVD
jgi:hypothetical protein